MNGEWRDSERAGLEPGVARVVYLDAEDDGLYGVEVADVPEQVDDRNYRATRKAIYEMARVLDVDRKKTTVALTREADGEVYVFRPCGSSIPEWPLLPGLHRIEFRKGLYA